MSRIGNASGGVNPAIGVEGYATGPAPKDCSPSIFLCLGRNLAPGLGGIGVAPRLPRLPPAPSGPRLAAAPRARMNSAAARPSRRTFAAQRRRISPRSGFYPRKLAFTRNVEAHPHSQGSKPGSPGLGSRSPVTLQQPIALPDFDRGAVRVAGAETGCPVDRRLVVRRVDVINREDVILVIQEVHLVALHGPVRDDVCASHPVPTPANTLLQTTKLPKNSGSRRGFGPLPYGPLTKSPDSDRQARVSQRRVRTSQVTFILQATR